ncbi:MAG: sulfatase [bacterium]
MDKADQSKTPWQQIRDAMRIGFYFGLFWGAVETLAVFAAYPYLSALSKIWLFLSGELLYASASVLIVFVTCIPFALSKKLRAFLEPKDRLEILGLLALSISTSILYNIFWWFKRLILLIDVSPPAGWSARIVLLGLDTAVFFLIVLLLYAILKKIFSRLSPRFVFRTVLFLLLLTAAGAGSAELVKVLHPHDLIPLAANKGLENKPNVLLITIDTMRADYLSCYGHPQKTSPHIDRIAEEGVTFLQAFSQASMTAPSHASMFTSLYPFRHGVRRNNHPYLGKEKTIAEILQAKGYRTAAFISAEPLKSTLCRLNKGFDVYDEKFTSRLFAVDEVARFMLIEFIDESGILGSVEMDPIERRASDTNQDVIKWLAKKRNPPFFAWIHYYDPHSPYRAPKKLVDKFYSGGDPYDPKKTSMRNMEIPDDMRSELRGITDLDYVRANYAAEVNYTDQYIGELRQTLEELKLLDNTILVIVGDHGEGLGEHNYMEHAAKIYEEQLWIPLIVRFPQRFTGGLKIREMVASVDIAPTVLDLIGFEGISGSDGRSFLPLTQEGYKKENSRHLYAETVKWDERSMRSDRYKLIRNGKSEQRFELYDLIEDPDESRNLSADRKEVFSALQKELDEIIKKDPVPDLTKNATTNQRTLDRLKSLGYL